MDIKTESIIDTVEVTLNKKINDISIDELDKVKYLRVCRNNTDDILIVDSNDLKYFNNLNELSIEGCMIDEIFIENITKLTNLLKISFINCDFIIEPKGYFNNLVIDTLVLNNNEGLNNINLSNIKNLILINCSFNTVINDVDIVDITRSLDINIDINNSYFKEIIISNNHNLNNYLNYKCKIIIKNDYDEEIKVIDNV